MGLIQQGQQTREDVIAKLAQSAAQSVPEKYKDAFERTVLAGKKVMYSDQTHQLMQEALSQGGDPVAAVGKGVMQLMGILSKESRGTLPQEVFMPASLALMADALDYVKQTKGVPVGAPEVERATESFTGALMESAGITPSALQSAMAKTGEVMQDPQMRQLVEGRNGA